MADNTTLNAGTGGDVIATDDIGGVKYQIVKHAYGALDTATLVTSSVGLPTDPLDRAARDCGKIDIAMGQGAHDAAGAGFDPIGVSGWASAAAPTDVSADGDVVKAWYLRNGAQASVLTAAGALIGGDAGNGLDVDVTRMSALVAGSAIIGKVGIDQTTPGTTNLVALAANQSVNVAQVGGTNTVTGGVAGIIAVGGNVANAGTATAYPVPVGGTFVTAPTTLTTGQTATLQFTAAQNVKTDLTTIAGTAPSTGTGTGGAGIPRVTVSSDSSLATVSTVSTVTSLTQMNGAAISMGTGVRGAGVQRVTIATDDIVPASQSGTWTVQPGNTANTTPWLTTNIPATSGGETIFHLISAATTNATNVKASAGQLYGWSIFNTNAAVRYVKLHNTAGTPTAGTGVVYTIAVPATGGTNFSVTNGIAFSTGIGITTVTDTADAGTTAVGASDLVINLHYK